MDAKKEDGRVEGGLAEGGYGKVAVDDDHQFGMKWKGKRKARA